MRPIVPRTIVPRTIAGKDAILAAAAKGDTRAVLALVKSGTDPNTTDARGATPVWVAAENGHTQTVRALVQCGADASTPKEGGETPVFAAAFSGHTDTVRALVKECGADASTPKEGGETPVFAAAFSGHTDTVRALVKECHANPDTADELGFTPVFIAAHNDKSETVRALVHDCRADPFPALVDAAIHDDTEMIWKLVRECGFDPACRNRDGNTARDLARPGSRAYQLLECLEKLQAPGHTLYTLENEGKRAEGFECPLCLETRGDAIAFFPCGHRVCPSCWPGLRDADIPCPLCREPILHGVMQRRFPDGHKLFSRFCVELPRARRL